MLLMVAIAACGGNGKDEYWPCGTSQCFGVKASDESVPDISAPIFFDTSVTKSQAVRLADWIFELRKEAGNPRTAPKFLQIQDDRFILLQYGASPEAKALTPEEQARNDEFMCKMSNEVFDGLPITSISHFLIPDTYSPEELTNYAFSTEQQPPRSTASCGSGLAKEEDVKPAPAEPTPNLDATVEARVRLVQHPPTYTPFPTYTPAPTPSPQVVFVEVTPTPEPTVQAVVESNGVKLLSWTKPVRQGHLWEITGVIENTNDEARRSIKIAFPAYDRDDYFLGEISESGILIPARTKYRFEAFEIFYNRVVKKIGLPELDGGSPK